MFIVLILCVLKYIKIKSKNLIKLKNLIYYINKNYLYFDIKCSPPKAQCFKKSKAFIF